MNCGPTLYPVANRKRSKKTTLTTVGTSMPSCPMSTPASRVPTTLPTRKEPIFRRPSTNPPASVRKIASSGFVRSAVRTYVIDHASSGYQEDPRCSDHQVQQHTQRGVDRPHAVQL